MTKATFEQAEEVAVKHIKDYAERHSLMSELTVDDWDIISNYVWNKFSDEERGILHTYDSFQREFIKGHRCSVCGRTDAQNKALGYNCYEEC